MKGLFDVNAPTLMPMQDGITTNIIQLVERISIIQNKKPIW